MASYSAREGEDSNAFTLPRVGEREQIDEFAGGSVSEFYELSGEGKRLSPLPARFVKLAYRPSREFVKLLAFSSAREGEIIGIFTLPRRIAGHSRCMHLREGR